MGFMQVKNEAWRLSRQIPASQVEWVPPNPDRRVIEPMLAELRDHPDERVSLLACAVAMRLGYWIPT